MLVKRNYNLEKNKAKLITVDGEVTIGHKRRMKEVVIEVPLLVGNNSCIEAKKISAFCQIGKECIIKKTSVIGRYVTIGDFCNIGCRNQENRDVFSNSAIMRKGSNAPWNYGVFNWNEERKQVDKNRGFVEIGSDVWIGNNVIIYEGVKIGCGAIIHSGSVVMCDVEPYSIVLGNPAHEVKKRFEEDLINDFLEVKWWEKTFECIDEMDKNCSDFRELLNKIKDNKDVPSFKHIVINSFLNEVLYEENGVVELLYKI